MDVIHLLAIIYQCYRPIFSLLWPLRNFQCPFHFTYKSNVKSFHISLHSIRLECCHSPPPEMNFFGLSAFHRYSNMSGRPLLITLPNNLETHLDLLLRPLCASFNSACLWVRKVFKCRFRLVVPFLIPSLLYAPPLSDFQMSLFYVPFEIFPNIHVFYEFY